MPPFKVRSGIVAKRAAPPNEGALINKYLHSEEWLYSRGVPTIRRGSRYVPDGQPVKLDRPPWPPVFDCCLANDLDRVGQWVESGHAHVNIRNPRTGRCLLHDAATNGLIDMAKMLVDKYDANVNVTTTMGEETPLHLAVKSGQRFLVFYLITRGADTTAVNRFGMNPLHYVDRKSIASLLISNGTPLVQRNVHKENPWQYVEKMYPWQKELVSHLKDLTSIEEMERFKLRASQMRIVMQGSKVPSVIIAQMEIERKKRATEVITQATKSYLRWRNGEHWN